MELAEKDRLKGGQGNRAEVGVIDGEGDESLVRGGDIEPLLSVDMDGPGGLRASVGGRKSSTACLSIVILFVSQIE